jgi:hypothetical protein
VLFAYPLAATDENWLYESLALTLQEAMDNIDAGVPRMPWPDCIAAERRERLRRFSQLGEHLKVFLTCYETLDAGARIVVRRAMNDQSALTELFDGARCADRLGDLPEQSRMPAQQFFEKAFDMLKPLGIRDQNYRTFLKLIHHRVCAFCGCEYFSGATSKREPLDHYLAISLYPFAGANARNLVPMGPRCNSSYKLAQDVLRNREGLRRVCFDPYAATPVHVSLMGSRLFAREGGLPDWQVDLEGDAARVDTWDDVFQIKRRFAEDHLDSIYKNAIKVFGALWRKRPEMLTMESGMCGAFRYLAELSQAKGWSDRAFLETSLYKLLEARCAAGGSEADRIAAEFSSTASIA